MTDQIIATFGFICLVFGVTAGLRIALRASLIAGLMIEELFAAPRQAAAPILNDRIDRPEARGRPAPVDAPRAEFRLAA